jgi:hypothetical protein
MALGIGRYRESLDRNSEGDEHANCKFRVDSDGIRLRDPLCDRPLPVVGERYFAMHNPRAADSAAGTMKVAYVAGITS